MRELEIGERIETASIGDPARIQATRIVCKDVLDVLRNR